MVRVWKDQYEIRKTKFVQALNKNWLFIERIGKTTALKSGLYYIEVDFHELGPQAKLSDYIETHAPTLLEAVIEYPAALNVSMLMWDVMGTPLALAVSYVNKIDPSTHTMVLKVKSFESMESSPDGWAICQEDPLDGSPFTHQLEMISNPHDMTKIYVLYSTNNGLDGGKH